MIYTSEKIKNILTSPAGNRFISYITPMYSDAEIALRIFQALGLQIDDMSKWAEEIWLQMNPSAATWALPYWEREYHLKTDPEMSLEERRKLLIAKIQTRAPMNPYRLENMISAIAGTKADILENTARNAFRIVTQGQTDKIPEIRSFTDSAKPAHIIYDIIQYVKRSSAIPIISGVFNTARTAYGNSVAWKINPLHEINSAITIGAYTTTKTRYSNSITWKINSLQQIDVRRKHAVVSTNYYYYRNEVR